ncbi:protein enabled homolog [Phoenix dactylifera]|uniref:Protein enabled homolog n=1 Tax=Phoenix dactylifera TaxID=42345 RepID=A0A8B7BZM5_PHODC|nr:protein enabled homolog [Phoenix dactylifera]
MRSPPPTPLLCALASLSAAPSPISAALPTPPRRPPTTTIISAAAVLLKEKEKEMKPPAGEAPTEVDQLEVARILRKLPKLVLEAESRRLPDFLRWGARRRRSALDDDISLLDPPPPPPPPSISPPPPDGNVERKDGDRGGGGGATSSPATPFSFPASGSEEPDGRPPRPPFFPAKVFKATERHMERVKKQNQLIASLSDEKARLQRSKTEFDALYQQLKARNSWLQHLQSKVAVRQSMEEEGQRKRQRQQQDRSSGLAPLSPTTLPSPATRPLVDPHSQRWEIQPPPVDRIAAGGGTPSPSVAAEGQWSEKIGALALNATPEEEQGEWERRSAYEAQPKKRRLEMQREKNDSYSPSFFSMTQKMPRLR